nr:Rep [Pittosporum tobira alphasatellite]
MSSAPPQGKSTWWVFTRNFDVTKPRPVLELGEAQYIAYQHEKKGHDHLQGVVQMKKQCRWKPVSKLIGGNPHLEIMYGSAEEAINYAKKEESRVEGPWELGEYIPQGSHKRKQRESVQRSPDRMAEENPSVYRRVVAKMSIEHLTAECPALAGRILKEWQVELFEALELQPDDRTIIWVYGPDGGEGKSTVARDLAKQGWFYTRGGQSDNVAYQYVGQLGAHVVFDIPRDKKEYIQYSLIEMLKDRMIISNKYEPLTAYNQNDIHVVVMANFEPDFEKISRDRIKVINCNRESVGPYWCVHHKVMCPHGYCHHCTGRTPGASYCPMGRM